MVACLVSEITMSSYGVLVNRAFSLGNKRNLLRKTKIETDFSQKKNNPPDKSDSEDGDDDEGEDAEDGGDDGPGPDPGLGAGGHPRLRQGRVLLTGAVSLLPVKCLVMLNVR